MAKVLVTDTNLTNIANAIREKNGLSTTYKPSEMANAISNIETGPSVTKGVVINSCDSDGYPTDISLVGMTTIPNYYFYYTFYYSGSSYGFFSKVGSNFHLPNNLTSIGNYAFNYCYGLTITELPDSVTSIGSYAFAYCVGLALNKLPSSLTTIGSAGFSNCSNVTFTVVPSGVTNISSNAFIRCSKLTELTFQGYVSVINSYAFNNCSALTKVIFPNVTSVPRLSDANAFVNTPIAKGTGYIYVPDTLVDSFKSASNWSSLADQIKGVSEL